MYVMIIDLWCIKWLAVLLVSCTNKQIFLSCLAIFFYSAATRVNAQNKCIANKSV